MLKVRLQDPSFVNWVPKTAVEAVDRFTRCKNNGLHPYMVPECLIECSKGLADAELDLFEEYVINPQGVDTTNIMPFDGLRQQLENEHVLLLKNGDEVPPLPAEIDDEKISVVDQALIEDEERRLDRLRNLELL